MTVYISSKFDKTSVLNTSMWYVPPSYSLRIMNVPVHDLVIVVVHYTFVM
jgi:hypothetical protein